MEILTNTYFTGAGLLDIGLDAGGLTIQQSFEIDQICCDTLRLNFQHEVIQSDITKKLVANEKPCHVRAFTYPCNTYSAIADIHGARTGDDLYLHAFRHMAIDPPEVYVAENVPGIKKFPLVMEAMTRLPGYHVYVACPVRSSTWLPQKRDRVIIIGAKRPFAWRPPEALRPITLKEILEPDPRPHIPDYVATRLSGKVYRDRPIISDPERGDIAPTCVAHYSKDCSTRLVADRNFPHGARPYTVREYARLQGVPDSFQFAGSANDAYRMIGNGVSVPVGRWIGSEIVRYMTQ
jgi:DNA (cytosine-5)-methyltransferase 1